MGLEQVMKFVLEKMKEALLALENVGSEALAWFDKVFPPETRAEKINHWFHVALPYLIAAAVLTVVVCFCRCCGCFRRCSCGCFRLRRCCGCFRLRRCCGCFSRCFSRSFSRCFRCCDRLDDGDEYYHEDIDELMVKMMKAPGRNCRMPRHDFESDPRGYFQKLRNYPGDELC